MYTEPAYFSVHFPCVFAKHANITSYIVRCNHCSSYIELCASNWTHLRATTEGSSSTPGRCRSSRVALGSFFHSSSSLFICVADICLALVCSLSDGTRTSQVRKVRSWISGSQLDGFLQYREKNIRVQLDGFREKLCRGDCLDLTSSDTK